MTQNTPPKTGLEVVQRDKILPLVAELKNIPEHLPDDLKAVIVKTLKERIEYYIDWQEAYEMSESNLLPVEYQGKPYNAVVAFRMGRSLGLDRYQAVQNLYTVNGHTRIWGDMMLAVAMKDPRFIDCVETEGPDVKVDDEHGLVPEWTQCVVKVKGRTDIVKRYTVEDAKRNPNWDNPKVGTWKTNPRRMMQHKPRGFALRDALPDRLGGLYSEYEFEEIQAAPKDITDQVVDLGKQNSGTQSLKNKIKPQENTEELAEEQGDTDSPNAEVPKNIDEIKEDFSLWLSKKLVKQESYNEFIEVATKQEWEKVIEMHQDFKGSFVVKLSQIVDLPEYKSTIQSLLKSKELVSNRQVNELRTDDEETAKRVYELIEKTKEFVDKEEKDLAQQAEDATA